MVTERLVADEILPPGISVRGGHPRDSSQLLLGLMTLSRWAQTCSNSESDPLEGIISKGVLKTLISALNFRDVGSVAHARRVAILAVGMGNCLGWDPPQQKMLEVASLLHDIGKIGVPDHILFKPDKLSVEETELMDLHRNIAIAVLQACRVNHEVLEVISQAHSHYNGETSGYRQIGSDVHLGARILAVVDAYDSLSTDQEYRQAKPHREVIEILMKEAGSKFDGNVIHSLDRWIANEGSPFSREVAQSTSSSTASRGQPAREAGLLCHIFSYLYFLESLYDGYYLVDSDLRYVVWNRGIEHLLGQSPSEVLGQVWSSRTPCHANKLGRPLAERDCPMHKVIETGKPNTSTVQVQHCDGQWIEVELQSVPLFDTENRLHGVAQIFKDNRRNSRVPEYRELKMAASRDALTGVANRGELEQQLELFVSEFERQADPEPFSVIFLDIDFFKKINDTFGHSAGDRVLVELSRLLQHEMYSGELVSRYGGEEFVILCPGTDLEQGHRRAERLRNAISHSSIGDLKGYRVTSSFGVTQAEPGDTAETVLKRADKALYISKETGRNRTTKLTQAMLQDETQEEHQDDKPDDPFVFTCTFEACVDSDMVVYKLKGFVDAHDVKLKEVSRERVTMQVGRRGLLPFWGNRDERRPVVLEIEFGNDRSSTGPDSHQILRCASITARVLPVGRIRDVAVFEARARRVLKALRSYFVVN